LPNEIPLFQKEFNYAWQVNTKDFVKIAKTLGNAPLLEFVEFFFSIQTFLKKNGKEKTMQNSELRKTKSFIKKKFEESITIVFCFKSNFEI